MRQIVLVMHWQHKEAQCRATDPSLFYPYSLVPISHLPQVLFVFLRSLRNHFPANDRTKATTKNTEQKRKTNL